MRITSGAPVSAPVKKVPRQTDHFLMGAGN